MSRSHGAEMITCGDKSRFAIEFQFEKNPDPPCFQPEMEASWGKFAIWVKDKNLCRFIFTESKSGEYKQEEYICWYILPIINWFTTNWAPLFSEQKPPEASDKDCAYLMGLNFAQRRLWGSFDPKKDRRWYEWVKRHSLRSCREGGLFPDIYFRGSGENVEISWGENPLPGEPENFKFLETTAATTIARKYVTETCYSFLNQAINNLLEVVPESQILMTLKKQIETLSISSMPDLKWLWRFLDDKLLEKVREKISSLGFLNNDVLPAPSMMFGTLSPQIDEDDVGKIIDSIELSTEESGLHKYEPNPSAEIKDVPYRAGYALAEDFMERYREKFDTSKSYVDIVQIVDFFGIQHKEIRLNDKTLRGIALAGEGITPLILVNVSCSYNNEYTGKRYTIAHEFCHLLCDKQYGQEVGIASGSWAPQFIEKRANAFAGMLLMPTEMIEEYMETEEEFEWNLENFEFLMDKLIVGKKTLLEHLHNLDFINPDEKELLEEELFAWRET